MITQHDLALKIRDELAEYVASEVRRYGMTTALPATSRVKFHWPPHSVSQDYHVTADQFTDHAQVVIDGESYEVRVASTRYGYFGRVEKLWHEGKADSLDQLMVELQAVAQPLIFRQHLISQLLGEPKRFSGSISELPPLGLLKLLYSPDRDISQEASVAIESHASSHAFGESLLFIITDRSHPHRRAAQWAVLDLWEDLPSFSAHADQQSEAIQAIRNLIWDAEDDYARTIYKAGVVLGGHICTIEAAESLLECFAAPSRIGRRAAYHASFHLAEWLPETRARIVGSLREQAEVDPEPVLQDYCRSMANDIENQVHDHVADPLFENE